MPPPVKRRTRDQTNTPAPNEPPAKLQRLDTPDSEAVSQANDTTSKKSAPIIKNSPKKNQGPVLDLKAELVPQDEYIHPEALSLFEQVQNLQDFRVAAMIFWISYFAYRRGEDVEGRNRLFELVAEKIDAEWRAEFGETFRRIFDQEHETLVERFEKRFIEYRDQWIASAAGTEFFKEKDNTKKQKKSGPRLVHGDITKYKPGSLECEGIQWGYRQILDIFLPLCEVADDADVYPESLNLSETPPDSLAKWFKADLAAVKKETQAQQSGQSGHSWFNRLATACATTLIQLIYIHFEFLDLLGKKPMKKASLVADLVRRVPTPPTASGQFDHFPMNSATLQQWVRYFESDSHSEVDIKPTALLDIESLEHDEFADIDPDDLADDLRSAHNVDQVIGQSVVDEFADNGFDLDNYTESDFFNVLSYPPAPVLPFQPSPFAKAMDSCNIYGQAAIMLRRFDQEQSRMLLLTASCDKQIGLLKDLGRDLRKKVDEYEEGRQILMSRGSEHKVHDKNIKDMQKSVVRYEQNSALKEYYERNEGMRRELDRNQKRNSAGPEDRRRTFSPFQASPLAAPAVRHPSAPVATSTASFNRPLSAYFGDSTTTLFGTNPPADVLGLSQTPIASPPSQPTSTVNGIIPAAEPAKGVSSRTGGVDEFDEEVGIMKEMGLDGIPDIPDKTLQK